MGGSSMMALGRKHTMAGVNWIKSSLEWQNRTLDFKAKVYKWNNIWHETFTELLLSSAFSPLVCTVCNGNGEDVLEQGRKKSTLESIKIRVAFIYGNLYHHIMRFEPLSLSTTAHQFHPDFFIHAHARTRKRKERRSSEKKTPGEHFI